jgi:predicted metal-dependent phosphotriesterase family hydrolase
MATDPSCRVMTVLGTIKGEDLGFVLMNEHLICDPSRRAQLPTQETSSSLPPPPQGMITLETLAAVKAQPFQHVENLTLSSRNEATAALQTVPCGTLVDVTNLAHGRDFAAAKALSESLGIHVVLGTSCPPSPPTNDTEASQQDIEFMEQELLYGIDDTTVCAGFIGEIEISPAFHPSELRQLKAAAVVQKMTQAPLIVSETTPNQQTLKVVDHISSCGATLSRTILTHMDHYLVDHQNLSFLQQILERGAILCFDRFSVSSACFDPDQHYPTIPQVVHGISHLLQIQPEFIHQIVLSSGVFMKLQYPKYGGMGFGVLQNYLVPRLLAHGLSPEQIHTLTHDNPRRLLQWWKPPPPKQVPKEYIPCSICKTMFEPILGEYYTKFTFCGTDCLRKHRLNKFQPLE